MRLSAPVICQFPRLMGREISPGPPLRLSTLLLASLLLPRELLKASPRNPQGDGYQEGWGGLGVGAFPEAEGVGNEGGRVRRWGTAMGPQGGCEAVAAREWQAQWTGCVCVCKALGQDLVCGLCGTKRQACAWPNCL